MQKEADALDNKRLLNLAIANEDGALLAAEQAKEVRDTTDALQSVRKKTDVTTHGK